MPTIIKSAARTIGTKLWNKPIIKKIPPKNSVIDEKYETKTTKSAHSSTWIRHLIYLLNVLFLWEGNNLEL